MKRNDPPPPTTSERTEGATLTEQEMVEKIRHGEIDIRDMKIQERERYRKYAPVWKR